ncbi:phosphatase PAP2 family protein [Desulfosporosinus sp. Sb-LF]|uniref:phosphatase PAP2 family protein n=1 Tax=Desulfosporosinus sp. Sb-LF TaxID=2560027 RepID=UPI00107F6662|nr:phosphatase PAP2 family protein [Desulfosporosinus sp. Sb-LF]TGE34307.1 phosphatase PAP2 family protein [Desulfosporosinus sp. Sb-LF]
MLSFYQTIQSFHNTSTDAFFILLSFLGSEPTYILIISVLFWNVDKRFGFRLAVLFLTSMAFNGFLKGFFHTQRPIGQSGVRSIYLSSATGNSFPSGHSQGVATFYPYLWQRWRSQKRLLGIGIFMIVGIGFSRLYLGLHWPGDVLGGYLLGALIVLGFQQLDETLFRLPIPLPSKLLLSVTLPLIFLLVYHTHEGWQMVGFVIGFTSGYFLEDSFLDYREHTRFAFSICKTLVGLAILGLWVWLWHPLTHYYPWVYLPVLTLGGLWTSFGAPYIFRRFGWEGPLGDDKSVAVRIVGRTDQT